MLWHVVKVRFAGDASNEDRAAWEQSVVDLAGRVAEIRFVRVARSIDEADVTGLIVGLDDERALAVYREHPEHLPVVARMRELAAEVTRLDVMTDDPPTALARLA